MNRRGILGAIVGAPIAGPAIVKEAAQSMASGALLGETPAFVNCASQTAIGAIGQNIMGPDAAIRKAFKLGLVSRETVSNLLASSGLGESVNTYLHNLDPDLQTSKSLSLSARYRIQRERIQEKAIERFIDPPQSIWEFGRDLLSKRIISGDEA